MEYKTIMYQGRPIYFKLKKFDYRKQFGNDITTVLVQYDPQTETITVDERASQKYVKYATVHECFCCGPYCKLAPKTKDPNDRCKEIDWQIIAAMPVKDQKEYVQKRIEMFETLLNRNLNPALE